MVLSQPFVWWKHGTIYQVYPRSFQDTNGDGVGDLPGVIARLDYLLELGVDAIWLSPFFKSPMADFGYDVSDHTAVDPLFGTMDDFHELVAQAHARGLRIILDFIPNHTSDQHAWFQESRSSRRNPKRDWYVWRDPAPGGGPPNNWVSEFGGSGWEWDAQTGQYYYHGFLREQPDLDWRNPEVVDAMLDVLRFWLDKGVDGFRVDAIHFLIEDALLRDDAPNPDWRPGMPPTEKLLRDRSLDQPEVHDAIARMRQVCDSGDACVLIGEAYLPVERLMAYYGGQGEGFHLPFNFHLIITPWTPRAIAALIEDYEAKLPSHGWPNWVLGNHDRQRVASRVGADQAPVAAMLLLTLRGTPTLYQGDELGMMDGEIPPTAVQDPWEINMPGLGLGRDPVRTPMPWSDEPNAGFSTTPPWLPLNPDWPTANVAAQAADPDSLLSFHRRLLGLRRERGSLHAGSFELIGADDQTLVYLRACEGERTVVALNLTAATTTAKLPPGRLLLSTSPHRPLARVEGVLALGPNEGVILAQDAA